MLTKEIECLGQAFEKMYSWLPPENFRDAIIIGIVVADINALTIRRKRPHVVTAFSAIRFDNQIGQFFQPDRAFAAEIEDPPICLITRGRRQQRFNGVIDETEVTQLLTIPNLEWLSLEQQTDPQPKK